MSEDHTAEREAFEAWYSAEDQETDDPERTYELTEEGMNELTKYCVWQGWQARAAAPAQERIQALELEVRQLTEQIAELRHAPTPQADSQPAPLREGEWINDAGRIKWLMWRVQDLEAKLAARAPADSVLEDAARYQWIRGPGEESTRYSRWLIEYWDGPNGWQPMQRERMDSAIDAAMNKGGAA